MQPFKVAHAAAEDWAHVAKECADRLGRVEDGGHLGFIYVTDDLAEDFASVLTYLRQKTGVEDWVGSVGMGVCAGDSEYFERPAAVAMVATFPEDSYRIFPTINEDAGQLTADTRAWVDRVSSPFGMVHGDPNNPNTPGLIEDLAGFTSGFLVGGLTSSRTACHQVAGRITGGGLSGVLFSPAVEVATGLSQGCTPIGASHVISDCLDNVIIGLDGEKALDVFRDDIGELLARDLNKVAGYVHAALPIEGSDTGDYMVRNLVGIDPVRGWLAIGGEVQSGDRVMFVRRDPKAAAEDLRIQLAKLKRRLPSEPRGGVYISCIARGPNMFGEEGREITLVRQALGAVPMVGFYAGGEISNNRLYGYTGVVALFL